MKFKIFAEFCNRIEATTKRLEMIDLIVDLFKVTPVNEIKWLVNLLQGKLHPDYVGLEIGIADKLALRGIERATGISLKKLSSWFVETGDLGLTCEKALRIKTQSSLLSFLGKEEDLELKEVYNGLDKIARASGKKSQDIKLDILAGLLMKASPLEGKYILRIVTGRLRLGVADATILEALALHFLGSRDQRIVLERAYNISSDLGLVAETVASKGLDGLKEFRVHPGIPLRPMLAQRLASPEEILEKMGGKCAVEYKYDGERMQIHKVGDNVSIFSRRLENITFHYPDVVKLTKLHVKADTAIFEAECVAVEPETGELRPFQELMHRRRKYGIQEALREYPVSLMVFECLFVDGEDLTNRSYLERREVLGKVLSEGERTKIVESEIVSSPEEMENFFLRAIEDGCEGLIAKDISEKSIYRAGKREFLWIKLKRSYMSKMIEPVDLVIVGAYYGKGKRKGIYGALLLASYNSEEDVFETVCKCGTGFTDEDLSNLPKILNPFKMESRHARVRAELDADVWFVPSKVIEVIGDEITLSPVHTCAKNSVREDAGLAIRFPRFTGRYRDDKSAEQATTTKEIIEMYNKQLKKIEEK